MGPTTLGEKVGSLQTKHKGVKTRTRESTGSYTRIRKRQKRGAHTKNARVFIRIKR